MQQNSPLTRRTTYRSLGDNVECTDSRKLNLATKLAADGRTDSEPTQGCARPKAKTRIQGLQTDSFYLHIGNPRFLKISQSRKCKAALQFAQQWWPQKQQYDSSTQVCFVCNQRMLNICGIIYILYFHLPQSPDWAVTKHVTLLGQWNIFSIYLRQDYSTLKIAMVLLARLSTEQSLRGLHV